MLFENGSFDVNIPLFVSDVDFSSMDSGTNKVLMPMEGFLRGNMFKNE